MRSRIILAVLGVVILFAGYRVIQRRQAGTAYFDTPLKVTTSDLGIDPGSNPPFHNQLICTYFRDFMVKEIVFDQPGDEQISIVPGSASHSPTCQRANVSNEIVIDWSGSLEGVKTPYLFLAGDDSFGLLFPFAVFDARTGKKLFEDGITSKDLFESIEVKGAALTTRFKRVVQLQCSLLRDPRNDGAACWEKSRRELHLEMPMPDCSEAYRKDGPDTPDDPSDIAYDVRAEWDGLQFSVTPIGHSAICGARP